MTQILLCDLFLSRRHKLSSPVFLIVEFAQRDGRTCIKKSVAARWQICRHVICIVNNDSIAPLY
jgi:hypothetical protein